MAETTLYILTLGWIWSCSHRRPYLRRLRISGSKGLWFYCNCSCAYPPASIKVLFTVKIMHSILLSHTRPLFGISWHLFSLRKQSAKSQARQQRQPTYQMYAGLGTDSLRVLQAHWLHRWFSKNGSLYPTVGILPPSYPSTRRWTHTADLAESFLLASVYSVFFPLRIDTPLSLDFILSSVTHFVVIHNLYLELFELHQNRRFLAAF